MNKTRLIAARKPIQGLQRMYITSYGPLTLGCYVLPSTLTNSTTRL